MSDPTRGEVTDTRRCRCCETELPDMIRLRLNPLCPVHGRPEDAQSSALVHEETLRCADCGLPYVDFPLDVSLPDAQWLAIFGRPGGVLCADCIARRGRAHGATVMTAILDLPQTTTPGQAPCPRCGAPAETYSDGAPSLYCRACGYAEDRRGSREARLRALSATIRERADHVRHTADPTGAWVLDEWADALDAALASSPQSSGETGLRKWVRHAPECWFRGCTPDEAVAVAQEHPGGRKHTCTCGLDAVLASHPSEAWDAWRATAPDGGQDEE